MNKPILDVACGSRMFWFDKTNPNTVFADIRSENHTLIDGRKLEVKPDKIMDFRDIDYPDGTFKLVVFDPPHLKGAGENGWMAKKYGTLGRDWQNDLRQGFAECWRVLDDYGVLVFKWHEHSIKVSEVLRLFPEKPLFGHPTALNGKTHWMCFMKAPTHTTKEDS